MLLNLTYLTALKKRLKSVLNFDQNVSWKLLEIYCIPADLLDALQWYGHQGMYCKKKTLIGWRNCMEYEVEGSRPRGRPKTTWREVVQKDCQARNLNREDAVDHRWVGGWMFLPVPAQPGNHGQRAVKRLLCSESWNIFSASQCSSNVESLSPWLHWWLSAQFIQ